MATVYIWDNTEHTGHASISISNDYISFHPNRSPYPSADVADVLDYNRSHPVNLLNIADHTFLAFFTGKRDDEYKYGGHINAINVDNLDEDLEHF